MHHTMHPSLQSLDLRQSATMIQPSPTTSAPCVMPPQRTTVARPKSSNGPHPNLDNPFGSSTGPSSFVDCTTSAFAHVCSPVCMPTIRLTPSFSIAGVLLSDLIWKL